MKKNFFATLFLSLFFASNCFAAVTFKWIEVNTTSQDSQWTFVTNVLLYQPYSPSQEVSFSVDSGDPQSMNHVFFGDDVYTSDVIGTPSDFVGKTFSWDATDGSDSVSATAVIPSLARQVAPSTDVTISSNPSPKHPTVSWTNLDPSLHAYRLRVVLASDPMQLLWEANIGPSAQDMTYTFCGFSFQPGVSYLIRIEAREYLQFPVTGTGLETMEVKDSQGNPLASFLNRSVVLVNYAYDAAPPSPTADFYTDPYTGLEWLFMSKSVCISPDSIKNGTDDDGLASQGWKHASLAQISTLLMNVGMAEPFDGTSSPWNFEGANRLINILGATRTATDPYGDSVFIQAFAGEGPPAQPTMLFTPSVNTVSTPYGDMGGAYLAGIVVPSSFLLPTIGNWLVRSPADELMLDFGSLGLYHYDGTTLKRINRRSPNNLVKYGKKLAANFPGVGLYEYDGASWAKLSKNDGQEGMCGYGNTLYVDFGSGAGLYNYNGSWSRINRNSPEQMWCWGSLLYADFGPGIGLYVYDGAWYRITKTDPQDICVTGSGLYVDFGSGVGLYKYDGTWTRINKNPTQDMCSIGGDLYVDFGAAIGLYKYDGTWTRITKSDLEGMCAVGTTLYVDFGAKGLYKYEGGMWARINKQSPEGMVSYANKLVANFPSVGLYEYDGSTWKKINPNNCEDVIAVDLY